MNKYSNIPDKLKTRYEFYNYGHALDILTSEYYDQWQEIVDCLDRVKIKKSDILAGGGSKTNIVKAYDEIMFNYGWKESQIIGDLHVKVYDRKKGGNIDDEIIIEKFIEGHNIDYVKYKVAFDLEWNSKDQTYDRDLSAMRIYYECNVIDVGIIVTRSESLNEVFNELGMKKKYGASTTWMGKLLPRLESRRQGGCPILAIGIKKENIIDG